MDASIDMMIAGEISRRLVGFGGYRELTLSHMGPVTRGSLKTMNISMSIIANANGFGRVMVFQQVPGSVTASLAGLSDMLALHLLVLKVNLLIIGWA